MAKRSIYSNVRSTKGVTAVEMLIACLIMGIVSSAILGLLLTSMRTSKRLNNKIDAIDAARMAIDKIGRDVRMGRSLGDVYGNMNGFGFIDGSDTFPSNANPLYGNGQSPPNGWPWGLSSYTCNNQTMVVQIPIFDSLGFPTAIPGTNPPQPNLETHVYRIVPDDNRPGEWRMEWAKIPGANVLTNVPNVGDRYVPAQRQMMSSVLVKGIIGPMPMGNAIGPPQVFQYLDKTRPADPPSNSIVPSTAAANYSGVVVNLELIRQDDTARTPQIVAFKSEVFLRNNALATTVGSP